MLPFLKNRAPQTGLIVQERKHESNQEDECLAIESCIREFMEAAERKDMKKMAIIVKLAHDILHEYMDSKEIEDLEG